MSTRTFTTIIIILLVLGTIVFGFFWYRNNQGSSNTAGGTNSVFDLFPSSGNKTKTTDPTSNETATTPTDSTTTNPITVSSSLSHLMEITAEPVAGETAFTELVPTSTTSVSTTTTPITESRFVIRYMKRSNGNIYDVYPGTTMPAVRVTNTTIPRIYEAFFNKTGDQVVFRYFNEKTNQIDTYSANIKRDTPESAAALVGSFLPFNISSLSLSPDKTKLYYLYPFSGRTISVTSDFTGLNKKQITDTAFNEWISQWPNTDFVTLTTKSSGLYPGYVYKVSLKSTSPILERILGGINGLTTAMSPDGTRVLYSQTINNRPMLYVYNINRKTTTSMNLVGLPEKCIWSNDSIHIYCGIPTAPENGVYPDIWYQGLVSFNDTLWKLNSDNSINQLLVSPSDEKGQQIDATRLFLDDKETHLLFINKSNSSLWTYTF